MTVSDREARLKQALRHTVLKGHEWTPSACDGCLDALAWIAVPGYDGERAHPLLRIGEEAL
jgi:hypothetical protein